MHEIEITNHIKALEGQKELDLDEIQQIEDDMVTYETKDNNYLLHSRLFRLKGRAKYAMSLTNWEILKREYGKQSELTSLFTDIDFLRDRTVPELKSLYPKLVKECEEFRIEDYVKEPFMVHQIRHEINKRLRIYDTRIKRSLLIPTDGPGVYLKNLRTSKNMSIREFARATGVSASLINRIELDNREISLPVANSIIENLDLDATEFYKHTGFQACMLSYDLSSLLEEGASIQFKGKELNKDQRKKILDVIREVSV